MEALHHFRMPTSTQYSTQCMSDTSCSSRQWIEFGVKEFIYGERIVSLHIVPQTQTAGEEACFPSLVVRKRASVRDLECQEH